MKTDSQIRKSEQSHLCRGPYMSRDAVGTMSSVPRPRGDVCKWVRLILHVGPFACQILSLIIRGQCLHKTDAVPKDVVRRLCETEKQRPRRCIKPTADTAKNVFSVGIGPSWGVQEEFCGKMNTHLYFYRCEDSYWNNAFPKHVWWHANVWAPWPDLVVSVNSLVRSEGTGTWKHFAMFLKLSPALWGAQTFARHCR